MKISNGEIIKQAKLELARREFFFYCHLMAPDFYRTDRTYLVELCDRLQKFMESDKKVLVINMPPRFGKSRSATMFVQWLLGKNNKLRVMTGSYNEMLSSTFAKQVRDTIATEPSQGVIVYQDIFPETKIKYGEASMSKWALEGSQVANYLATSPTGTSTGFGADVIIVDDLIKNSEEAYNANKLESHIDWFTNTMLSRTEKGFKLIIIMTRWATNDLAGFILENFDDVDHINYKAIGDDGKSLDEDILSVEDFNFKTKHMDKAIVYANYQQEPIDIEGKLYSSIKTYETLPKDANGNLLFTTIKNYTDTADTGSDYLCSINYGVYEKEAYVLDVIYTKDSMEITEPLLANSLYDYRVNEADIESNNGGRGFARSVERILKEKYKSNKTKINWFHQSKNKQARILSNSTWVMDHIYFPKNWMDRWPEFAKAILTYQKEGKNKYDDGPDVLTGVAEKNNNVKRFGW
nr:MAG TPA: Terminase [Caudoviricetes sp.]